MVTGLISGQTLKFNLANIHCHTPSEHTIDGVQYSMECHFVHSLDTNYSGGSGNNYNKLVIGVFYDATKGQQNTFIDGMGLQNFTVKQSVNINRQLVSILILILQGQLGIWLIIT